MNLGKRLDEIAQITGASRRHLENAIDYGNEDFGDFTLSFVSGYRGAEGGESYISFIGKIVNRTTQEEEFYHITGEYNSWTDGYTDFDYAERVYPKFDATVQTNSYQSLDYFTESGFKAYSEAQPCLSPTAQYLEDSARTASEMADENRIITKKMLLNALEGALAGNASDSVKRALFYRDPNTQERYNKNMERIRLIGEKIALGSEEYKVSKKQVNMFHAIVGLISEAGELIEEFADALSSNREMDDVNFVEEIGDQLWYQALGLRQVNGTFDNAMSTNINKLKKRYPDNFTSKHAVVRDLEGERKLLEDQAKVK